MTNNKENVIFVSRTTMPQTAHCNGLGGMTGPFPLRLKLKQELFSLEMHYDIEGSNCKRISGRFATTESRTNKEDGISSKVENDSHRR